VLSSVEVAVIDEEDLMQIRALARQGYTYAQIGRMLGPDWRTVKRYLEEGAQPAYRRRRMPSKLDRFKPLIDQWLDGEPKLLSTSPGARGTRMSRQRPHGTHGEIIAVRAERDRAALLPLPVSEDLVVERTTRVVARDGFFSFEGRRYHVPDAKPGERVELVLGDQELEVRSRDDRRLIARHQRGRPALVLPGPVEQSVPLAQVLRAVPDPEVHRRPLSRYEEAIGG
jgi:hypothetical protein